MWVGLGWIYVMGWVGLNFFFTHHGGLDQKIPSTRSNLTYAHLYHWTPPQALCELG